MDLSPKSFYSGYPHEFQTIEIKKKIPHGEKQILSLTSYFPTDDFIYITIFV